MNQGTQTDKSLLPELLKKILRINTIYSKKKELLSILYEKLLEKKRDRIIIIIMYVEHSYVIYLHCKLD